MDDFESKKTFLHLEPPYQVFVWKRKNRNKEKKKKKMRGVKHNVESVFLCRLLVNISKGLSISNMVKNYSYANGHLTHPKIAIRWCVYSRKGFSYVTGILPKWSTSLA